MTRISNGKNLFMIGDVKQSIYGFRNCTPQIFLKKESDYSFNNGGVCNNLNLNYRSGTNILEFVNFIFDRVMNKDNCGIEYASNCDLICDPDGVQNDNHAPIKLDIFNKASRDFPNVDLQSGKIVEYIRGILGTDRLDYKTRTNKKIDYRDIAILLRNRTNALNIYYTLKKSGIPVKIDFKIDLFACYEVQMLVDILKCVANDKDDIALTSFLAGPLCKFSSNELAMIKQGSEGDNFYTRVTNYTGDKDIEAKIANAYSILRDLRQKLQEGNVVNMLNYMIDRYDLENILRASDKDGSRITNVKKFLSILNSSDNSNIYRTLALIELLQSGDGVDVTLSDDSNAVTIMTMHKSKGLEWPVVIIPFLEVKPKEDQMESIIVQDDFGVGINYRDIDSRRLQRSIFFNATKLAKFEEEYAERIRLLYVALTRAKNHLYMIGCMDMSKIDRQLSPLEDEYDNYLSMILGCIKDSKEYTSLKVTGSASVKLFGGYQFDISVQEPKFKEEEESAKADISVSEDMMDKIRTYQNFTYPYMDDTDIAIKNTVTSILKESDDYTMLTDAPRKLHTSDMAHGASANEYGTAYHRVLEYALTHPDVDIATVLDMLLKDNKISLDVRNMLDIDNIEHSKRDILSKIANRKYVCEAQFMMKVPHKDIISGSGTESKILVQGVCDLVIFGAGEITLVDYKTNRRDLDSIADMYAVQLGIYAKALELRYGVPVKKLIYSTYSNAWVEV